MKRISAWFDRHTKLRIALQLVLDGLPFIQMIGFGVCVYNLFTYPLELEWLMDVGIFGFLIAALPLLIIGIKLKSDAEGEFACYPWCDWVSRILRIFSALGVSVSVMLDLFLIIALVGV